MEWTYENDRPIYTQLVEQISRAVLTGEYSPGGKLPGIRELASDAGVNPNTMQKALTELESLNLVFSRRTSGYFVTEDTMKINQMRNQLAIEQTERFLHSMHALGCSKSEISSFVKQVQEHMKEEVT